MRGVLTDKFENRLYKNGLFRSLILIGLAAFWVLLGKHFFFGTTTVSEEQHCLVEEYCFYIYIITLICFVLFCETLLRIWNNCFIKAVSPVKSWCTVNLQQLRGFVTMLLSCYKFTENHGFLGLIALIYICKYNI